MKELKPKLFSVMKNYTKEQFVKDVIAGIIVAIIALPLSIALAIASGVGPEKGLYTAIIAGFFIALLGGSRVQIGGPTAAFVVIIYGIIETYGFDGLVVATIMAGVIMIIFGLFRMGNLIKFIPYTITTGFTAGIAVGIAAGQIKDFTGMDIDKVPSDFLDKMKVYFNNLDNINYMALAIGMLALLICIFWPKVTQKVPGSLIAIIVTTLIVNLADLNVNTIGDLYDVPSKLPGLSVPNVNFKLIQQLISPAFTIAILASIESLLSAVVADGMIGSKHKSNAELVAQGVGNIFSGLFGGLPATGAIARTAANIKNGGRTPIAGIVHSITLLIILVVLMPYAKMIPMTTLAAVLIMVAYNMCDYKACIRLCKKAPKSDIIVLVVTFGLTVIFDLVVAIEVSMVITALLFMKRMADVTGVESWKYVEDDEDAENIGLKNVPKNTLVYEISGPMFFGVADKLMSMIDDPSKDVIIIRMRSVPAIDATALHSLIQMYERCKKEKITLIFSHINEQPMHVMEKAGFDQQIGPDNICENIDAALERAASLVH